MHPKQRVTASAQPLRKEQLTWIWHVDITVTYQIFEQKTYLLIAKAYQIGLYHNGFWEVLLYS